MSLGIFLLLIWCHFIGDFPLQTDEMALNKSKSNKFLSIHAATYTLPFLSLWLFYPLMYLAPFLLANGTAHWIIDWCTSRINSKLWAKGDRHNFFTMVGFDQALHITYLVGSMWLLGRIYP